MQAMAWHKTCIKEKLIVWSYAEVESEGRRLLSGCRSTQRPSGSSGAAPVGGTVLGGSSRCRIMRGHAHIHLEGHRNFTFVELGQNGRKLDHVHSDKISDFFSGKEKKIETAENQTR